MCRQDNGEEHRIVLAGLGLTLSREKINKYMRISAKDSVDNETELWG